MAGSRPILFENVEGWLILKPFYKFVKSLISIENNRLPWELI